MNLVRIKNRTIAKLLPPFPSLAGKFVYSYEPLEFKDVPWTPAIKILRAGFSFCLQPCSSACTYSVLAAADTKGTGDMINRYVMNTGGRMLKSPKKGQVPKRATEAAIREKAFSNEFLYEEM